MTQAQAQTATMILDIDAATIEREYALMAADETTLDILAYECEMDEFEAAQYDDGNLLGGAAHRY